MSSTSPQPTGGPLPRRRLLVLEGLAVFLVAMGAFGWAVLPQDALVTIDGYYHIKLASLVWSEGPWVDVRWLPLTILGEHGTDHHWLWHVLIAPFGLATPDPQTGLFTALKWAAVVTAAGVTLAAWATARALSVPWAPLFAGLAVTGALIMPGRLVMLRTQDLAIVFVLAALWALARSRHLALALIALLFMWSYHGAVILAPLVLVHAALTLVRERRLPWRPACAAASGGVAGLVLSPWFPDNVEYLFFHTLYKVTNPEQLRVGSEWAPVGLGHTLTEAWPVYAALAAGALALLLPRTGTREDGARDHRGLAPDTWLALGATGLMLILYMGAWRFAEYFVPVGAIAAGLLWRDARLAKLTTGLPRLVLPLALAIVITLQATQGTALIRRLGEFVPTKYARIGEHLRAHAAAGDMVFNRSWEDFVFLLWQDDRLRFVSGLDPHYLSYADPPRFRLWLWLQQLTPDETNDPTPLIDNAFGARWVVVDRGGENLARALSRSRRARLRVESEWGWLYEIIPAASAEAPDGVAPPTPAGQRANSAPPDGAPPAPPRTP